VLNEVVLRVDDMPAPDPASWENFPQSAGIQDDEFHAQSLRGLLRILYLGLKARARWIRKEAD
jgi:hypothetical protein